MAKKHPEPEHEPHHPHPHPPPPHHHPRASSSAIASFIDRARIDELLAPWVPAAPDRAFVARCLLDEGPAHHRGANYVVLALLGDLIAQLGAAPVAGGPSAPVPMRLPPHLQRGHAHVDEGHEQAFPLRLPTAPLDRLAPAGSPAQAAMIDCLTDGPPQHALANALTVALLGALREALPGRAP